MTGRTGITEDELIARYFRPLAGEGGLALLDDAACLRPPPGQDLVVTADALVAGVHFFPHDPADAIAWKALAVNLSDLAAKGAEPLGYVLSLALPPGWTEGWMAGFAEGLRACGEFGGCSLLGGDTVRTPGPLTLSITAFGLVPPGRMIPRTGARPDDALYVSGSIGDAALGLMLRIAEEPRRKPLPWIAALDAGGQEHLRARYLRPQPRLALRPALQAHASGAMDVSDGLVGDISKMMAASGVSAAVEISRVPLSPAASAAVAADPAALTLAVTGGDDYEVLCSVPHAGCSAFEEAAARCGIPVARIGDVIAGDAPPSFSLGTRAMTFERGSFSHF
jgi:thiamine-monophosphate kinase